MANPNRSILSANALIKTEPRSTPLSSKDRAERLQHEFIPRGEAVELGKLSFGFTLDDEIYRCCVQTSRDPQSGPIYCGAVAEFVALIEHDYVGLCGKRGHVPPKPAPK